MLRRAARLATLSLLAVSFASAENGEQAWLRYAALDPSAAIQYRSLPHLVVHSGSSDIGANAARELTRGLHAMLGAELAQSSTLPNQNAFLLGTVPEISRLLPGWRSPSTLPPESFAISHSSVNGRTYWIVTGGDDRGELYGVFHLLEQVAQLHPLTDDTEAPSAPIRWVNQWDNLDGSIERGYAGRSIFFDRGHVRADLTRASEYARLLSSVGLNGCTVNNVNADLHVLEPATLRELSRIADAFRPWGVRMSISIDLSSPQVVGHLPTFDPLDPTVAAWWQSKTDEVYRLIPDLAGFVVKADSEGRAGPSQYGRTPAEAANVLARALAPHHGVVLYRGFVYNHHLDWQDLKADRARAGFDNFAPLDGKFDPNVIIQIKHGPIDFQAREPVSPLFAALRHTSQAIELQATQEYTGQQRHMVFLVPMWKTMLDTDLHAPGADGQPRSTPVKQIVEGRRFPQPSGAPRPGGFVSVVNVGLDTNWLHHPMALANLYGYGKLAWSPDLTSEQIVDTWTRLTFGNNPLVVSTIDKLQLNSWRTYENYTGPLGVGTLTDIIGIHFGPGIESAERNGWGQWIRADHLGIGMDRTVATGTGYIGQYPPALAHTYESLATCPDDLLLFMHHVPYTHVLHSGKTVIQHVYDSHYEGPATASTYAPVWTRLHGLIDDQRYTAVLHLFEYQAGHALVWRDAINDWFFRISGISDTAGRVGHHPDRIEAEAMTSDGYKSVDVTPWETASGSKAVTCDRTSACTLSTILNKPPGAYTLSVQYFDIRDGVAGFDLLLNDRPIAHWAADDTVPPAVLDEHLDGHTSTRFTLPRISLKPGDTLTLRGTPQDLDRAAVDYIEITPTTP